MRTHVLTERSSVLEAIYASTFANVWEAEAHSAIRTLHDLAAIHHLPAEHAVARIHRAVKEWGFSAYLSRKIIYVKEHLAHSERSRSSLEEIDTLLDYDKLPQLQLSAMENMKESVSIFSAARRHTSVFKRQSEGGFRRNHYLNNLVATPFSENDCAGYILRAVETSFLDCIVAITVVTNLEKQFPTVAEAIRRSLSTSVIASLEELRRQLESADQPKLCSIADSVSIGDQVPAQEETLSAYRKGSAFLEYPSVCMFRNAIDKVVGCRLVADLVPEEVLPKAWERTGVELLTKEDGDVVQEQMYEVSMDSFYRTFLFLRFISERSNIPLLTGSIIQDIFDRTANLEALMSERELQDLQVCASDHERAIVAVLALALYRSKSAEPDIDFDFRTQLVNYVIENFSGSIPKFIDSVSAKHPNVASYLTSALDEVMLQKLYGLVRSASEADAIRREILRIMGAKLNRMEYIIEAEAIETRAKVAKLKGYFDSSRMFVDSVAMKKWLVANTSAFAEKCKELPSVMRAIVSRAYGSSTVEASEGDIDVVERRHRYERMVEQVASEAFLVFCTNNEFGLESYLARRIRHNTLQGIMTSDIDAVLNDHVHRPIVSGTPFGKSLHAWKNHYIARVERLRKELLQFRSDSKPNALFSAAVDMSDPATRLGVRQLAHSALISGPELLDDLVVSFCWQQIGPQLESAARYIRVAMYNEVVQEMNHALMHYDGQQEQKIKAQLLTNLASVLQQVASWFQIPQAGFASATIPEICNIIDIEHGRSARPTNVSVDAVCARYYGITVHRLYDCLAVLMHNAFVHGRSDAEVDVSVKCAPIEGTALHELSVEVVSMLPEVGAEVSISRVRAAVDSIECSADLVTEGYSGIKKVKVITKMNEGQSTLRYSVRGGRVCIAFTLKAEVASEQDNYDESSSY